MSASVSRLIQQFTPKHYDINLTINRVERTFSGEVTIEGSVITPNQPIRLHAKELKIDSATLSGNSLSWHMEQHDELVLEAEEIKSGEHKLLINFSGKITDSMNGMYPCYYEHDGVKKELIATQFESHYAREVFPCVDEPEAKATYSVTLNTEKNVTVLGNMPVISQTKNETTLTTVFDKTPLMSTYLLAWVVGEFHKKTATTKSGVEVNVWATKAQSAESLDFGLDIATRTIDFFDEYFETPYPLPKSDHVALPDFSSGAMENWGLITYRETALLADPKLTSLSDRKYAATVIAHELSHQWFGNLVTMKWWNDLWLNESFATMMEYLAIDAIEPDWNIWLLNATMDVPSALLRDALDGIQAIQCDVNHPDEIQTLFDPSIVYAKGGRLLRMLQTYLGNEAMRQGLALYFKKFAYKNTEANDLWACLSEASGKDITDFMNTWITQPGYPLLHVSQTEIGINLRQERFFTGEHQDSDSIWPIPLNCSSPDAPEILEAKSLSVETNLDSLPIMNIGGTAHFITHYDDALLSKIIENLPNLKPVDRIYILQEQSLLSRAGIISSASLIPLISAMYDETEDSVWDVISMIIGDLKKFVEFNDSAEKALRKLVRELASKQFERLVWDEKPSEPESDTILRSTIISLMLYGEDELVVKEALSRFDIDKLNSIDAEMRPVIISTAVKYGDEKLAETLVEKYRQSSHSGLRDDISSGLTSTTSANIAIKLTDLLKDSSTIRPQDFTRWLAWLMRNRYSRELTWSWFRNNWQWIHDSFSSDSHYDMLPRYIAGALVTEEQFNEYNEFFEPLLDNPTLKRNITIGATEIKSRVELIKRDGADVYQKLISA